MEAITNRRRVSTSPAFGTTGYYVWQLITVTVRDEVTVRLIREGDIVAECTISTGIILTELIVSN